jgi:hypothetical protein
MFFSKKSGFNCLVLYVQSDEPHPVQVVIPQELAADVVSTIQKFEKSSLNHHRFIGNLGPFFIIQEIQGFQKIEIHNDTLSWSEPMLYTDFAKKITERMQLLINEESDEVEEDVVYFIGEFTMMQDNGFVAPF